MVAAARPWLLPQDRFTRRLIDWFNVQLKGGTNRCLYQRANLLSVMIVGVHFTVVIPVFVVFEACARQKDLLPGPSWMYACAGLITLVGSIFLAIKLIKSLTLYVQNSDAGASVRELVATLAEADTQADPMVRELRARNLRVDVQALDPAFAPAGPHWLEWSSSPVAVTITRHPAVPH